MKNKTTLYKVLGKVIPSHVKSKQNTRKAWEYGYNEKYDVVVISRDGTIGDIIEIKGLKIALPKAPTVKNIDGYHKVPKNQYWEKLDIPYITKNNEADHSDFIEQEYQRRKGGYWFYNNGEPEYITGDHYFMLQYCKVEGIVPWFNVPQQVVFIFWEACKADERCYGMSFLKSRRIGFSTIAYVSLLNSATRTKDSLFGIVSKTQGDASSIFRKLVSSFRSLPMFLKPMVAGSTSPKKELLLDEPSQRISKNNKFVEDSEGLGTKIDFRATALNSYDSERVKMILLDEGAKFPKDVDFEQYWSILRTTMELGRSIVGKALVGSTMNALQKGGDKFKNVYEDSCVIPIAKNRGGRDANGRTPSGLYALFIPAEENLEGFFDRYGYIVKNDPPEPVMGLDGHLIKQGSSTFLKNKRKALEGNKVALYEEIRKYPNSEKEAFRDPAQNSNFDIIRIQEQIDYIEGLAQTPYIVGDLLWKNGERDTEVYFSENPNGRFKMAWKPLPEYRNAKFQKGGVYYPSNARFGAGGVDSYDIDKVVDKKGSNGALHLKTKRNIGGNVPSNQFVLEYIFRPPLAREFYEDCLKAAVYYGYPLLIENNKPAIIRYFIDRGYEGYVMKRPKKLMQKNSRYHGKGIEHGVPSTSDVIQAHAEAIQYYITENCGWKSSDDGIPEAGNMFFTETLHDWMKFDPTNRTERDASVSSGLAILACDLAEDVKREKVVISNFFAKGKVHLG